MRVPFTYRGCTVFPCDCYLSSTWGKNDEPIDFGDGKYRTKFWRVEFPDDSWVKVKDKQSAREYIDRHLGKEVK